MGGEAEECGKKKEEGGSQVKDSRKRRTLRKAMIRIHQSDIHPDMFRGLAAFTGSDACSIALYYWASLEAARGADGSAIPAWADRGEAERVFREVREKYFRKASEPPSWIRFESASAESMRRHRAYLAAVAASERAAVLEERNA